MKHSPLTSQIRAPYTALICCRISDKKQQQGSGLDSQEHRCRQYAEINGFPVEEVFLETMSGATSLLDRPAIRSLLAHIDRNAQTGKRYVVVFDDHKRFSRETENHLVLKRLLRERDVRVEFLNLQIEDTPEGRFSETIFAAQAQLEREQNARQSRQKSIARLEMGYAVQSVPPIGYKYIQGRSGGKELIPDEPYASIVREAMQGFASGRFATQAEVTRFLEGQPDFPKDLPGGGVRQYKAVRMLRQKLYAGYVGMPKWGIAYREGLHEPLVAKSTFARIQERLDGRVYAAARKDYHEDFPLRGAVVCSSCGVPLTGAWSTGKTAKHAYYRCRTHECDRYGKSIRRKKIEDEFAELLMDVKPDTALLTLARAMFDDYWALQSEAAAARIRKLKSQLKGYEIQIDKLVDKIVNAASVKVEQACEKRIEDLELEKSVIAEKIAGSATPVTPKRELFELSMKFLSSPCFIWKTGRFDLQRLVLKLVFPGHLTYCIDQGFFEPNFSLPFSMLGSKKPSGEKWCRRREWT